ncbi:hypothetical protein WME89_43885 [Sorangium sp. So ce321]|uniref:hypothetical protein n=1 Tax=Sorangium sp. So ce321 TaxID=3133300 RepID=UPI003F5F439A
MQTAPSSSASTSDSAARQAPPPPPSPPATEAVPPPATEAAPPPAAEVVPPPATEVVPPPAAEVVPSPAAEALPPPPQPPAQATASAPVPRSGHGLLKLNASRDATVYVTGVAVGPSNQPIEVRCGRFFVRLGEPTPKGTRWLTEGRTVIIKCGALTEASF